MSEEKEIMVCRKCGGLPRACWTGGGGIKLYCKKCNGIESDTGRGIGRIGSAIDAWNEQHGAKIPDTYHAAKHDAGKLRLDLIPPDVKRALGEVLTHGAETYGENTWRDVPEAKKRYHAAFERHLLDWQEGKTADKDSGLHPLKHALCNAAFLMSLECGDVPKV